MTTEVRAVRTEGLGDSTYLVAVDGFGLVVDPQRDIDRFLPIVEEMGVEMRWVADTHLHNDYVSGARDLSRALGAELLLPAGAAPSYRHTPVFHGEELAYRNVRLRPIHTPGHTPEHVSYLLLIDGSEVAVFTGGSLLVGAAGRSDLLGNDRSETLARLQYRSVTRIAALPEATTLYPTHGAGSFCTATAAGGHTSTVGAERRTNPVLTARDEDSFVAAHLANPVPYPRYYEAMGPTNLTALPAADFSAQLPRIAESEYPGLDGDVVIVDARLKGRFAAAHLPGSLGIEHRDDFAVWVGWVTPHNSPLVLVVDRDQPLEELRRQLARIGYDRVVGVIDDLDSWTETPMFSYPTHDVDGFLKSAGAGHQILDVRTPQEWEGGTVPGAVTAYAPDLATSVPTEIRRDRPVLIACGTGHRATIAASLLEARGYQPEVLVGQGVAHVLERQR